MTTILIFFYYPQEKTLERLGEMLEGYSVETCSRKILLVPMGGLAEVPTCMDWGTRTPISAIRIFGPSELRVPVEQLR